MWNIGAMIFSALNFQHFLSRFIIQAKIMSVGSPYIFDATTDKFFICLSSHILTVPCNGSV